MKTKEPIFNPNAVDLMDHESVKQFIGKNCAIRSKSGMGRWWVTIQEVRICNHKHALVKVAGHRAFGQARWVGTCDLMWK